MANRWTAFAGATLALIWLPVGQSGCGSNKLGDGLPDLVDCSSCHGSELNAAPPVSLNDATETTDPAVGAHQAHLVDGDLRHAVGCSECHKVPLTVEQEGHADALPAELTWGPLATSDGAVPSWNRESGTCSGTYCHGATLSGGSLSGPSWTTVDGSQDACGTCHGFPPPPPHFASNQCHTCHPDTVRQDGDIDLAGGKHIDGVLDAQGGHPDGYSDGDVHGADFNNDPESCKGCHGADLGGGQAGVSCQTCHPGFMNNCLFCHGGVDNASSAPPESVAGETATSVRGVGAHTNHMRRNSTWRADIPCSACHLRPADSSAPGHIDPRPAELAWGGISDADGAAPAFDGNSGTCSGTYCHGETLDPGGSNTTPVWTTVNGSQASCGTCHGLPPDLPHPQVGTCETCHDEVVAAGPVFLAPQRHVDGIVDVSPNACGSCHGLPPTAADEDYPGGGGAHPRHAISNGTTCSTCHGHDGSGPDHDEGNGTVLQANIDIQFDPNLVFPAGTTIANGGVPAESHNGGDPTCFVGCHNPVPGDSASLTNMARWNDTSISCAECHEKAGTEPPVSHDLDPNTEDDATVRAACLECHDHAAHTQGTVQIADPDPTDQDSFADGGTNGLCRTCHDGGGGTFFGGRTPRDISDYWTTPAIHESLGFDCTQCHDHHGRITGTVLVQWEENLCGTCHAEVAEMNDANTPTHHHVVDAEQTAGSPLECATCHDPHLVQKVPWRPVTHPDTDTLLATGDVPHDQGDEASAASNDNAVFCLACHDGTWQGAKNVAAELANGDVINTNFYKENENLHREHRDKLGGSGTDFACTYCHNTHGNTGTSGTYRGALLYDWIQVNQFPYQEKSSCSTSDSLGDCH